MSESKTEVQLKAKATNWLLTALIGVVSWIGKQHNDALKEISNELKTVSATVQVHSVEIGNLKETTNTLFAKLDDISGPFFDRPVAKHEEYYDYQRRQTTSSK